MRLPELDLTGANVWHDLRDSGESSPRFVLRYELECFRSDFGASTVDGERRELTRGTLLFARPGQIRHSRLPFSTGFIYFNVPNPGELDRILDRIPTFTPPDEAKIAAHERIVESFQRGEKLLATLRLLELLISLGEDSGVALRSAPKSGQREIFAAIEFMRENLTRKLSVTEMAALAGYSVPHFTAKFRELTGRSPYEYFTSLRINEAKRLLACEGVSIADVAEGLGFANSSHFCAQFKATLGLTPGEFLRSGQLSDYEIN